MDFARVFEKIIDNRRALWGSLVTSSLFVFSSPWWRPWVRSDSFSDIAILVLLVVLSISIGFVVVDVACVFYGKLRVWGGGLVRRKSNMKLVSGLSKSEILFMREFIIKDSNQICVRAPTGHRVVDSLRRKGMIYPTNTSLYGVYYRVEDEIGDIIFNNSDILFDGVSWSEMSDEKRVYVMCERPDY